MRKLISFLVAGVMVFCSVGTVMAEELDDEDSAIDEEMEELEGIDAGEDDAGFDLDSIFATVPAEAEDDEEPVEDEEEPEEAEDEEPAEEIPAVQEAAPAPAVTGDAALVEWTFPVPLSGLNQLYLVLANESHPLEDGYAPEGVETVKSRIDDESGNNINSGISMAASGKIQLMPAATNALFKMFSDAELEGINLYLRSGYRSWSDQKKRFARDPSEPAPGTCDYQTGLSCTVVNYENRGSALNATSYDVSKQAQWLKKNAARFGFIIRYPAGKEDITGHAYTPWHLRYVGVDVAKYMTENDLCLEEFIDEMNAAYDDFAARGGNVEAALAAAILPDGPVQLTDRGPDGDFEIVLFHD